MFDGIVHWSLAVLIDYIVVRSKVDKELDCVQLAVVDSVVECILTVSVHCVHVESVVNEDLDQPVIPHFGRVKQWSLVKVVLLLPVHAQRNALS